MSSVWRIVALSVLACYVGSGESLAENGAEKAEKRSFEFTYRVKLTDIPNDAKRIQAWLPIPQTAPGQVVSGIAIEGPGAMRIVSEPKYGNQFLRFEIAPDVPEPEILARYTITRFARAELHGESANEDVTSIAPHYLTRSRFIALDGPVEKEARSVAGDATDPLEVARKLYDNIVSTVRYDKSGEGWGRGDSLYACDARAGNCTDFHSLFIGEARALGLPARFIMGFPVPNDAPEGVIGGYHCWAEFYTPDHGWVPLDASEAHKHPERRAALFGGLDANRVRFTLGRDIRLPETDGAPLNYAVYPYVLVDGQAHASMETEYRYKNLD